MASAQFKGLLVAFIFCGYTFVYGQYDESFDWNGYTSWENDTKYRHTYVVNQRHPQASDDNPGTTDLPFLTINRAAQLVKPGEKVLIHQGVYREMIEPKFGGTGEDEMIAYEAAPGHEVIVKGSRVLEVDWFQRAILTSELPDSSGDYTWSRKVWIGKIPRSLFEGDYYPLKLQNILQEEHTMMPWAKLTKQLTPYKSPRGLLFQNGRRLTLLDERGDVSRFPGSFWVDPDGETLHVHPFGGGNPAYELFELAVQSHLFIPQKIGLGYIQVRGLTFEHCANGFLRTSTGAVNTRGGHHWIIEDNIIRQINSSGLEFGYRAYERTDPRVENVQPRKDKNLGGMLIRNNQIHDCGTAGIRSFVVKDAIIADNSIWNIGWQDAENYWECSGIKVLVASNSLLKGNHIHHIQGGNGIWVDWDNRYTRVTANIVHDVQNIQGGIFMEASRHPNMIDNNFIWNIDGNGIYGNESDRMIIAHNLVAKTTGPVVTARLTTGRTQNGQPLTVTKNQVFNNLFIDGGAVAEMANPDNSIDYNVYVTTREPNSIDLSVAIEHGFEKNSSQIRAYANFVRDVLWFHWQTKDPLLEVESLSVMDTDFFGRKRQPVTAPGPFDQLADNFSVLLLER